MAYETILVKKVEAHIGVITLNRPERMNALNDQLAAEVVMALDSLEQDREIRVVILTGAGRAFCAGGDLKGGRTGDQLIEERRPEAVRMGLRHGYLTRVPNRLHELDVPTIAMVNGIAVGGGFDYALACDLRVASDGARFRVAFTGLGVIPGTGMCWLLPRVVGMPKATELIFTNRFIEAQEAEKIGLVNKLVPAADLEKETMKLARDIADVPPLAVKLAKRALNQGAVSNFASALEFATMANSIAFNSGDFGESVAAFREKRKPAFKGR